MRQAGTTAHVREDILDARRLPCICPRQLDDERTARTIAFSEARGILVEMVACSRPGCSRTWKRITAT